MLNRRQFLLGGVAGLAVASIGLPAKAAAYHSPILRVYDEASFHVVDYGQNSHVPIEVWRTWYGDVHVVRPKTLYYMKSQEEDGTIIDVAYSEDAKESLTWLTPKS